MVLNDFESYQVHILVESNRLKPYKHYDYTAVTLIKEQKIH